MWQQPLPLLPVGILRIRHFGKHRIKGPDGEPGPLLPLWLRHRIQEDRLDQLMDGERLLLWLPGEERIGTCNGNHAVPLQDVTTGGLKLCPRCSPPWRKSASGMASGCKRAQT